jgi:hypothetical protein
MRVPNHPETQDIRERAIEPAQNGKIGQTGLLHPPLTLYNRRRN